MCRKLIYLISCAVLLCAVSSVQAAVLEITPDAPEPGAMDIASLVGAASDINNIGEGTPGPYDNDGTTYVAMDRGGQGQTFLTGDEEALITGVWVQQVSYTEPSDTWFRMQPGGQLQIRVTDPAASGTDAFVLSSETYDVTGEEENALPAEAANDPLGLGLWFHVILDAPVALAANTEYGFDLTSVSGLEGAMFFETLGIRDDAEGGNPYADGSAYVSGTGGVADNVLTPAPGDRVFVVELVNADKRVDVTAPGDTVQGVPNDGLMNGDNFGWPGAETPDLAIDDDTSTKFLHFKGELEPTGFQVTPTAGPSIVTGLTLTTANDEPPRDPVAFELSGSNESIDGPYELIASGDIVDFAQADAWPRFTMNATTISFDNDVAYAHYQLLFPAVRDAASANSMQIAEVELLGELEPEAEDTCTKNIIFVSFHGADDAPSQAAADVGFTEASDKGYTDLLKANGYDVTRYITTATPDAEVLNAADLVIIGRAVSSGNYSNDAATTWNNISAPMIIMGGYVLRSSRMGYTTGTTMVDTTGDVKLTVSDPTHPIFDGIAMTDGTMDNPFAGGAVVLPTDGVTVSRGISINNDPADDEGAVLATIAEASADTGPVGGMVIAEWPAGATLTHAGGAETDVLAGNRLVFLTGSREPSGVTGGDAAGLYDLLPDGEQMLLNAVKYMMPLEPVDPGTENLVHSYTFEDGTANDSVGEAHGTLVGGAAIVDGAMVTTEQDQWMEMPGDVIAMNTFEEVTIEAWYTPTAGANTSWSMLAYFGDSTDPDPSAGVGNDGFFITSARGDDVSRAAISVGDPAEPWGAESGANGPEYDDGMLHHMVSTIDATEITLYIDGVLYATTPLAANNSIAGISQNYAMLAKGGYGSDPEWIGAIQEFNIYNKAMSECEVLYLAGFRAPSILENPSFELPGTEKIKGWNGEGVGGTPAEDIPGWSSDSEVADSGVETGWGATDGEWTAFLMGGDPSVWQLTSHVIGADDVIELKVDSKNNWQATTLQLSLYYDDNGARVTVASSDVTLTDDIQEFSLVLSAADAPDAVGMQLGVELNNVTEASDSWLAIDNVRLDIQ